MREQGRRFLREVWRRRRKRRICMTQWREGVTGGMVEREWEENKEV